MNRTLIIGGPGTGKTSTLIDLVKDRLDVGVEPERIAFCSFTRQASYGARDRACQALSLHEDRFPFFRTLHSLVFRALGMTPSDVMSRDDYRALGDMLGYPISAEFDVLEGPAISNKNVGSVMLAIAEFSRNARISLRDAWLRHGGGVDWHDLVRFNSALNTYRGDQSSYDYTSMLERYAADGDPVPVDVAFIDEAQDLTALQWQVVRRAFSGVRELFVAGDDDQAIFRWSGADVEQFLTFNADTRRVLPISHRLPEKIFDVAGRIASRIRQRYPKNWSASDKKIGEVHHHIRLETAPVPREDTWLLLARCGYLLPQVAAWARALGVYYSYKGERSVPVEDVQAIMAYERARKGTRISGLDARAVANRRGLRRAFVEDAEYSIEDIGGDNGLWHETFTRIPAARREYYVECLRRGEDLRAPPRVRLDTFHGAKGAEAENVLMLTDFSTRTERGMRAAPDDEHRCFYVAASRAARSLHIVAPRTLRYYKV